MNVGQATVKDFLEWVSEKEDDIMFFVQLNSKVAKFACDDEWWEKKTIYLKSIPHEEAKEKILNYITENDGKWTSDIIFDLELEVDLVLNVLEELLEEELIEPRSSASKLSDER